MPFDLASAQPAKKPAAFDIGSAKPARAAKPSPARQAEGERRIDLLTRERAGIQQEQNDFERADTLLRPAMRTLSTVGSVIPGIATMLEAPVTAGIEAMGGQFSPSRDLLESMDVPPQNKLEKATDFIGDLLVPVGGEVKGAQLASKGLELASQSRVGPRIIKALADSPIGQAVGSFTGGLAGFGADEAQSDEFKQEHPVASELITAGATAAGGGVGAAATGVRRVGAPPPRRAPVTPGPTADPVARARDAGYTIPASARTAEGKRAAPIGSAAEGVSGRSQNQARVDQLNDQRVLEGIRKDLKLPNNTPITQPAIDAVLKETGTVYDAVRDSLPSLNMTPKLEKAIAAVGEKRRSNPLLKEAAKVSKLRERVGGVEQVSTRDVLAAVQEFRDNARLILRTAEKPEQVQMASAYREMADTLENGLDEAISAAGRPDLIPSLKNARVRRAKAYQALEAVSGKKRPGVALMDMDQAGEFLTGEMKLAADVTRDMSPNGPLHVNKAAGGGPNIIADAVQPLIRPAIQPALNSKMGQQAMFGPRVPESLVPYDTQQFEAPAIAEMPTEGMPFEPTGGLPPGVAFRNPRRPGEMELARDTSGDAEFPPAQGGIGDLVASEPPAGEGMPFAASPEVANVQGPRAPQALPAGIASQLEHFPGAKVPEEAALTEFTSDQPLERRRGAAEPYTGEERRSLIGAERQAVLDRPIGTPAGADSLTNDLLNNPEMAAAVRGDTLRNRDALMPPPLTDQEMLQIGLAPADLEMQQAAQPRPVASAEGIGAEIAPQDASIEAAIQELQRLGFTGEQINEILMRLE